MPFTDAELRAELYKQMGRSPEEVDANLLAGGDEPATVVDRGDSLNPGIGRDKLATAGLVFESNGLSKYLKDQGLMAEDDVAIKALDAGLDNAARARDGYNSVRDFFTKSGSDAIRRGGNVLEMVAGALYPLWNGDQQTFFGWLQGDSRDQVMMRLVGEPGRPEDGEDTLFMSSWEQLGKLAAASMTGKFDRAAMLADVEPRAFESLHNDLSVEDMVVNKAFAGDADAYGQWLAELNGSAGGKLAMAGLAAGTAFGSFASPLAIAGEVKVAASAVDRAIGPLVDVVRGLKAGKTLDDIKGAKLAADIQEALDPIGRTLGDAYNVQRRATKLRDSAKAAYEADKTTVSVVRRYVQSEKRLAEANDAVAKFRQGESEDVLVRKAPRTDPATLNVPTRGRTVEAVRRDVLAAGHATPAQVNEALKAIDVEGGAAAYQKLTAGIVKKIRAGEMLGASDYAAMNAWAKLPENVQAAIRIKGGGMPEVVREGALRSKPLDMEGWLKFDNLGELNQRSLLGPSDAEAAGDAAKALVEGADLGDVSMQRLMAPEYKNLGDAPKGIADGHWVREVKDKRFTETADAAQRNIMFPQQSAPGLVGLMLSPYRATMRAAFPMREPRHALKGTGIFQRVRAGQMNYEIGKGGSDEFLERTLTEAGVVKRGLRTGFQLRYDGESGEKSARSIARALDMEPTSEAFGKHWDTLTDKERTAVTEVRKWFDTLADRQGIQGKMRLSGYWRHLFTEEMFEGGARPLELVGLPVTAELNGSHLLPRLGKMGYSMDLLEVLENYNRAAHRKIHIEPALADALTLADKSGKAHVAKYTNAWVRELKGQPTFLDAALDEVAETVSSSLGIPVKLPPPSQWGAAIASIYYSSLIGGNVNYLLQNLGTGVLNPLARFGALSTAEGVLKMATPEGRAMAKAAKLDTAMSKLFEDSSLREYSDLMTSLGPKQSEFYVRGLSFHAALSQITRRSGKTLSEMAEDGTLRAALSEAVNASEQVQHIYGVSGRSPMLTRLVGRSAASVATQFLSFPAKQTEMLLEMAGEDAGHVMRYFGYGGIAQRLAAEELGIDASQWTGLGYLPQPRGDQAMPLSPGVQLLSAWVEWGEAARLGDPTKIERAQKELVNSLLGGVPVLGALRRSAESAARLESGAVTTPAGEFVRPLRLPEEIAPTLLQTQSVEEHQFRSVEAQHRQQVQNELFFRKRLMDDVVDGIRRGDDEKVEAAYLKAAEMGIPLSAGGSALEPLFMSRQLRWFMDEPMFMPFGFVPTEEDLRVPE